MKKSKLNMEKIVARLLVHHHANMVGITNILGMLHLISDEEWERRNCRHTMEVVEKIYPHTGYGSGDWFKDAKAAQGKKPSE